MNTSWLFALVHSSESPGFLGGEIEGASPSDSVILLGDFRAHVGNDSEAWRAGTACLIRPRVVMNTLFEHKDVHKNMLHQDILACRLVTNFQIVSDPQLHVLGLRVGSGAGEDAGQTSKGPTLRSSAPTFGRISAAF